MIDIFLSYAREDAEKARVLAEALMARGWSVFWDQAIRPGLRYRNEIEAALLGARCVIVAWSRHSIESTWVRQEADLGQERRVLVPVLLDPVTPPLGFREIQAADLVHWDGNLESKHFRLLSDAIAGHVGMPPNPADVSAIAVSQRSRPSFEILRDRLSDGSFGPALARIPAGKYKIGDVLGTGDPSERPVRQVSIAKPFAIGQYQVSFEDYEKFTRASAREPPPDQGWGRGRRPVIQVSWHDAVAYGQWLSEESGHHYRLPSEAEWECAARAGAETEYWWGNGIGRGKAHCENGGIPGDRRQTLPVGSFDPNAFGLYDTAGNVWEWVQDRWHENYSGAPSGAIPWEAGTSTHRVVRGGAWNSGPKALRCAFRCWCDPEYQENNLGFRIARDLG